MQRIGILGAGWLGKQVALQLHKQKYSVRVSTTQPSKKTELAQLGLSPYLISTFPTEGNNQEADFFKDLDTLIVSLTPNHHNIEQQSYPEAIQWIATQATQYNIDQVILFSTISVYENCTGLITEFSPLEPSSDKTRDIIQAEESLLTNNHFNAVILRLGGLIGEDRHPIYHITKRATLAQSNQWVNMVHSKDIISVVEQLVQHPTINDIFNIVAPIHQTKKEFYTQEALRLGITHLPEFLEEEGIKLKEINGQKITLILDFNYQELIP